uniref:N/A n=1 Tax=Ganoderma boninense TaxID=34458 RepID=A0A5K1K8F5_9APHY|nr:N/A [Ganoderma boninense]
MTTEANKEEPLILPEYVEGGQLRLSLSSASSASSAERTVLTCMIVKAFRPFTLSPVLIVSLDRSSAPTNVQAALPPTAIVKLYDRRCFTNVREEFDEAAPWSLDKEREYRKYLDDVAAGTVARGDFASQTFMWDNDVSDGEFEAYLHFQAHKIFDAERTAYERLHALQGTKIPKLYGTVGYDITLSDARSGGPTSVTETVPGLLLEYIPGPTLRQLVETWKARDPPLPNTVLVTLCDDAVSVVDRVSDFNVLNADVRVDNFLVREPFVHASSSTVVQDAVVLIDLGQARLRGTHEGEDEWTKAKWAQDETGAVGFVALGLVREFVGEDVWSYERSMRYYQPVEEE